MNSWRLLLHYGLRVLSYALQATLLLVIAVYLMTNLGESVTKSMPLLQMHPPSPDALPWIFLNTLASVGLVSGFLIQSFFYGVRYLYINHGLSRRRLWPAAALLILSVAGLGSACLHFYDGRLQPAESLRQGQSGLVSGWTYTLSHYPLAVWIMSGLTLLVLLMGLIMLLSGPEEGPDEETPENWTLLIDSVEHSYGSRKILKGAWLQLHQGEIVGLLGRNGCGKSTLMQILFGTIRADFCSLKLNGHPLKRLFALPDVCSYLPQRSFLPPGMRVRRAIRLFTGSPQGLGLLAAEPRILELLDKRVAELSGGEKRLLELGLILSLQRPFALLDEPFSELEPIYKARAREWIAQAARQGTGIVVSDHDYAQILKLNDRLLLMHQGQTQEIKDEQELKRRYLPV